MLSSIVPLGRFQVGSILLLVVALLSIFDSSYAAPVRGLGDFASLAKRVNPPPDLELFSEANALGVIKRAVGSNNYIFYFDGNEGKANTVADENTPPGYYSFDQIFTGDVLAKLGVASKTDPGIPEKLSEWMAKAARGPVLVIGREPPANPGSFWTLIEQPILRANLGKVVESIRYLDAGVTDVNKYYGYEHLNEHSGKVSYRACKRDGTCTTTKTTGDGQQDPETEVPISDSQTLNPPEDQTLEQHDSQDLTGPNETTSKDNGKVKGPGKGPTHPHRRSA